MRTSSTFSRREFLRTSIFAGLVARLANAQDAARAHEFPYVDGLCLALLETPGDIRLSGLSGLVFDVSAGEALKLPDGSPRWMRTFDATVRSMTESRAKLTQLNNVFIATDGKEIKNAFKSKKTAVFFQVQGGGEIVGEDLSRLGQLQKSGLRVFQLTHHHDNPLAGGSLMKTTSGLTKLGIEAVERMNSLGLIPDLSHSSDQTGLDTLKISKRPVIVSHGGARAIVDNARCTPDSIIRGVADSGGAMGIFMMSFWLTPEPVPTVDSYIRQLRHVINVGGIEAVGVANDFPLSGDQGLIEAKGDNSVAVKNYVPWWNSIAKIGGVLGFDKPPTHVAIPELNNIDRMRLIRAALEREKFKASEIEKIMGGNWIRVLSS